jgi:hypothetical protein
MRLTRVGVQQPRSLDQHLPVTRGDLLREYFRDIEYKVLEDSEQRLSVSAWDDQLLVIMAGGKDIDSLSLCVNVEHKPALSLSLKIAADLIPDLLSESEIDPGFVGDIRVAVSNQRRWVCRTNKDVLVRIASSRPHFIMSFTRLVLHPTGAGPVQEETPEYMRRIFDCLPP